jgi:endonuclease YncB( thermonuclease family)
VCGTMSLAALEALIAGVKLRCEAIEQDRSLIAKVYSPNGVDIGRRLVSAGRWEEPLSQRGLR